MCLGVILKSVKFNELSNCLLITSSRSHTFAFHLRYHRLLPTSPATAPQQASRHNPSRPGDSGCQFPDAMQNFIQSFLSRIWYSSICLADPHKGKVSSHSSWTVWDINWAIFSGEFIRGELDKDSVILLFSFSLWLVSVQDAILRSHLGTPRSLPRRVIRSTMALLKPTTTTLLPRWLPRPPRNWY